MAHRVILIALTGLLIEACGSVVAPGVPVSTTQPSRPSTASPASPPSARALPTPAPPSLAPDIPMAVTRAPQTVSVAPIRALLAGGPGGSVTTTMSGGEVRLHVVITGLTPGSTHAVHDHLGRCGSANSSPHLAVLTIAAADAQGTIVFDTTVPVSQSGPGRIVIVYLSSRPNLITGCADL